MYICMNVFCSCIEVSKIDETSLVNPLLQQSTSIQYYLTILVPWAQMGCQMVIKLQTSKDGTKLVVKDFINVHNHMVNKVEFVQNVV